MSGIRWSHRFVPPLPVHRLGSVTEVGLSTILFKQNFTFFLFSAISFSICKQLQLIKGNICRGGVFGQK